MRTGSSPSWMRLAVGEHERAVGPVDAFDDRGVDREIADAGVRVGDELDLDRTDEAVVGLARVLTDRVGELADQRIVEALEPGEVGFGHVHGEVVGDDGAADAERAARVELADEPATDLDGLQAAAKRLAEPTLDKPFEPALEPLESHCDRS